MKLKDREGYMGNQPIVALIQVEQQSFQNSHVSMYCFWKASKTIDFLHELHEIILNFTNLNTAGNERVSLMLNFFLMIENYRLFYAA